MREAVLQVASNGGSRCGPSLAFAEDISPFIRSPNLEPFIYYQCEITLTMNTPPPPARRVEKSDTDVQYYFLFYFSFILALLFYWFDVTLLLQCHHHITVRVGSLNAGVMSCCCVPGCKAYKRRESDKLWSFHFISQHPDWSAADSEMMSSNNLKRNQVTFQGKTPPTV